MSGSRGIPLHSRHRRAPLKTKDAIVRMRNIRPVWAGCLVSTCVLLANSAFGQTPPVRITLDEAIQMALQHNHSLLAARTTIQQSEAQEITANLRPNPTLFADWEYLPLQNTTGTFADYLNDSTEGDIGLSYLFERGKKRQHRLQAAEDATAVTRS